VWSAERINEIRAAESLWLEEWLLHEGGEGALADDASLYDHYRKRKAAIAEILDEESYQMIYLNEHGINPSE